MTAGEKLIYPKGAPLKAGVWDGMVAYVCFFGRMYDVYNTYINITGRCDRYDLER